MWKSVCGFTAVLSFTCGICEALPRQVRIVWNVDAGSACVYILTVPGKPWQIPVVPVDGRTCEAVEGYAVAPGMPTADPEVLKGDSVTVYAVHYNPVLYKPREAKALVFKPEEPEALALVAVLLRLGSGTGFQPGIRATAREPETIDNACSFSDMSKANACLNLVSKDLDAIRQLLATWQIRDWQGRAEVVAKHVTDTPEHLKRGDRDWLNPETITKTIEFDPAELSCKDGKSPLGSGCAREGFLDAIEHRVLSASAELSLFDLSVAAACTDKERCLPDLMASRRKALLDGFGEAGRILSGDARSGPLATFGVVIASLRTSFATLVRYRQALAAAGAREYFVELPSQNDVGRMATMAFTLALQEQDGTAQIVRSLTVRVKPDHPFVLGSAGLMWTGQGFPFRKLTIVQVPSASSDGKPMLIRTLTTTADSGAVRAAAGLLATGVRVGGSRSPVYATIGTTIDNNIFRTLMAGGAIFIPRWRSSIVAGALTSCGATDADLAPTIRAYSIGGVALDGLDLDKVPLPSVRHWTIVVGWTLNPF